MCTILLAAGLGWQAAPAEDLRSWLAEQGSRQQFSGVVLVVEGDRPVFEAAIGQADRATFRPNTIDTRFNLGSINKTFTAVAIAQLVQRGKLSFDDPIGKHLEDYPNRDAAAAVTIHHLLTHTSGLAPATDGRFGVGRPGSSVSELVESFAAQPLRFAPGSQQEYSNAGYVLLGRSVEVVSGSSYGDYVARHVYEPAGMRNTGFEPVPPASGSAAKGYVALGADGRPLMPRPNAGSPQRGVRGSPPATPGSPAATEPSSETTLPPLGVNSEILEPGNPAGGGYSTARDLLAFARALGQRKLLDPAMTELLLYGTFSGAARPKYGYALREEIVNGRRFVGNGGGAPGINAEFRFEPGGANAVVVLSNFSPPSATVVLQHVLGGLPASAMP
jgi:CubicO group peptidase (beta-lactamase class C family)